MVHPWRLYGELTDSKIHFVPLDDFTRAYTDGHDVWMNDRLNQAERRTAILHEVQHIQRGHICAPGRMAEWQIREYVARSLIPLPELARAIAWTMNEEELAEELWCDLATVKHRLFFLTPAEKGRVQAIIANIEEGL